MRHTVLDSPYDRNQMQTLFAMLADARVQANVAKRPPISGRWRKPAFAVWWKNLKRDRLGRKKRLTTVSGQTSSLIPQESPREGSQENIHVNPHMNPHVNPQGAAFPLAPRRSVGWRAPVSEGGADLYALLDGMSARQQAANRRDHLISELEAAVNNKRLAE